MREIGGGDATGVAVWGVTAVVGAALGVVMLRPGLTLVLPRRVAVEEAIEILLRFIDLSAVEGNAH